MLTYHHATCSIPATVASNGVMFLPPAGTARRNQGVAFMTHTLTEPLILSTPSAADYCGLGASTFEKLRVTGGGPAYIKLGRRVVYHRNDLEAWLEGKRRQSTSASC